MTTGFGVTAFPVREGHRRHDASACFRLLWGPGPQVCGDRTPIDPFEVIFARTPPPSLIPPRRRALALALSVSSPGFLRTKSPPSWNLGRFRARKEGLDSRETEDPAEKSRQ
ncbi:hypothetical protein COCNU_07G005030 [Cocos nucifera]|uniref:Uncharacterized protein n=1 Tax=Cocos nucifera TaxID=13894 RepID=A0A8K0IE68_COCNU|nr:hypothetical protein COCNU_07G005030 [Cocos nucifera]